MESPQERIKIKADPDLADLIPGFLEKRKLDLKLIDEGLRAGDFPAIQTVGHKMKGSGEGYGFLQITEIGRELETAAQQRDENGIHCQREALRRYLDAVEVIYD